jgi:hypothetical protein
VALDGRIHGSCVASWLGDLKSTIEGGPERFHDLHVGLGVHIIGR